MPTLLFFLYFNISLFHYFYISIFQYKYLHYELSVYAKYLSLLIVYARYPVEFCPSK